LVAVVIASCHHSSDKNDTQEQVALTGQAVVPGVTGTRLRMDAYSAAGTLLAAQNSDSGGNFSLGVARTANTRVFLMAIAPANPEARAIAVVDNDAQPVRIDSASTATAMALAASGSLNTPLADLKRDWTPEILALQTAIEAGKVKLCSSATAAPGEAPLDPLERIAERSRAERWPPLLTQIETEAAGKDGVAARLTRMQRLISQNITSANQFRTVGGAFDAVWATVPLGLARIAMTSLDNEGAATIGTQPYTENQLSTAAFFIAGVGIGDCREKAYMAAYAASLIPEIRQIAVVGVSRRSGGDHALTVACLDGVDKVDLGKFAVVTGDIYPPEVTTGRCFVIDPWLGPSNDPRAGQTVLLDPTYAIEQGWVADNAFKPIKLAREATAPVPTGKAAECTCGGSSVAVECAPFALPDDTSGRDAGVGENHLSVSITVDGRAVPFQPMSSQVVSGWSGTEADGNPAIIAWTGSAMPDSSSPSLELSMNAKVIRGAGNYRFGSFEDFFAGRQGGKLDFSSLAVPDGRGDALQMSTQPGGNLRLTSFGVNNGDHITGDFDCVVQGSRWVPETQQYATISGTITGSFDVTVAR
jgi:hypothetical protein